MVTTCQYCMNYYDDELSACPHTHHLLYPPGTPVTCDASSVWSDVPPLPGIVVSVETNNLRRVIIALPGEHGSVTAVTLPIEALL